LKCSSWESEVSTVREKEIKWSESRHRKRRKKILEVCAVAWERENGGFLQLIGEDQVFNNLDFVVSIYEMKRNINVFSYNSVK
jgi:hypothetical protein